jgi:cobalt/nickel transport system permease protein
VTVHIPDGYLSPQTCVVGFAVAVPVMATAAARVHKRVKTRNVPTLAMLAAVCFLIMMFNVPIPDGTTAHAVGGALVAILLGPWAAVIAVSVALAFQALLFGDGGVLAYGLNVVNMAIVLPFVSYGIYRLISGNVNLTSPRRAVAGFIGGYIGLNAAALCCGIELGIQPTLFHDASGAPLYSPYHLSQSVPAMLLAHLTVAGIAEGIITAAVVTYLQRANLPLLAVNHPGVAVDAEAAAEEGSHRRRLRPTVVAGAVMALLVVLTPLGLLAPGGAFGEDAPQDLNLNKLGLSTVPEGLNKYNGIWHNAIFNGYDFAGDAHPTMGYIVSAVVGILAVGLVVFTVTKLVMVLANRSTPSSSADSAEPSGTSERVRS